MKRLWDVARWFVVFLAGVASVFLARSAWDAVGPIRLEIRGVQFTKADGHWIVSFRTVPQVYSAPRLGTPALRLYIYLPEEEVRIRDSAPSRICAVLYAQEVRFDSATGRVSFDLPFEQNCVDNFDRPSLHLDTLAEFRILMDVRVERWPGGSRCAIAQFWFRRGDPSGGGNEWQVRRLYDLEVDED